MASTNITGFETKAEEIREFIVACGGRAQLTRSELRDYFGYGKLGCKVRKLILDSIKAKGMIVYVPWQNTDPDHVFIVLAA